jgi:hypothetical protein
MNAREVRARLETCRDVADLEGEREKDSQVVADELRALYLSFDESERLDADDIIAQWVLSNDEKKRFDALILIADMKIYSAKPTLELLARRLASDLRPGAPYDLAKLQRISAALDRPRSLGRSDP